MSGGAGLFGIEWSADQRGSERFLCPACGTDRDARRTTLRQHVAVLGRPVLPLRAPEDHLTCETCGHAWKAEVAAAVAASSEDRPARSRDRSTNPVRERLLAEDQRALLSVVAAMVLSDSRVRQVEKEVARAVVLRYTGLHLPGTRTDALLRSARGRWGDPVARLAKVRWLVEEPARRAIISAAYHVCAADRELHPEETRLLTRMGEALALGPQDVRRAMEEARRTSL